MRPIKSYIPKYLEEFLRLPMGKENLTTNASFDLKSEI